MTWYGKRYQLIFCCPYSAILGIGVPCQMEMGFICPQSVIFHGQSLSTSTRARNSNSNVSLLPGQTEAIPAQGQFCTDSIAGCSYNFQHRARGTVHRAQCSLAIPRVLHCCIPSADPSCNAVATSSTTVECIRFLPLSGCTSNESVVSNFCIICFRPMTLIGPTPFFHTLQCPEFLQSYSCTIVIIVVQPYQ